MKEIKADILGLFPTPLVDTSLGREITQIERDYIDSLENERNDNVLNYVSKNTYVLESEELSDIKHRIESALKFYIDNIICPNDSINFYITQSWLTWTYKGGSHFSHVHSNSVVSGVLYIDVDETMDNITFSKDNLDVFDFNKKIYNPFNSESWEIPVKNNKIILFPSTLKHGVNTTQNSNTRISLSFNTFFNGSAGVGDKLNKLIL
jgi:uncharacterized protein (TIGR02466 family)